MSSSPRWSIKRDPHPNPPHKGEGEDRVRPDVRVPLPLVGRGQGWGSHKTTKTGEAETSRPGSQAPGERSHASSGVDEALSIGH
jgi:hypothetical protein